MKNYRLYPLGERGQFVGVVEFLAADDDVALDIAARASAGRFCELWERSRFVTKLKPAAPKSESGA